jgi:hypothetical protein
VKDFKRLHLRSLKLKRAGRRQECISANFLLHKVGMESFHLILFSSWWWQTCYIGPDMGGKVNVLFVCYIFHHGFFFFQLGYVCPTLITVDSETPASNKFHYLTQQMCHIMILLHNVLVIKRFYVPEAHIMYLTVSS